MYPSILRKYVLLFMTIPLTQAALANTCALVDNGDGTVTDPNSSLMWLQDADTVGITNWNNASSIISGANYASYSD